MTKMWVSFGGIILLVIAVTFISLSRYKLKGRFTKFVTAFIAYISLIIASLIIFYVVFSGPTN